MDDYGRELMIVHKAIHPRVSGHTFETMFYDNGYVLTILKDRDGWYVAETETVGHGEEVPTNRRADVICTHIDHLEASYFGDTNDD